MRIDFMTLFPEAVKPLLTASILGRGLQKGLFSLGFFQIRDFTLDKQKRVDDAPYGGGFGMILQADPLFRCLTHIKNTVGSKPYVVCMSAGGKPYDQATARMLAKKEHIVLVCGHYEGIDQRFIDRCVDLELSCGDYVLTGGEIPAMAVADSVLRLLPGVLRDDLCFEEESYWSGLLEYPHYSRPEVWDGRSVPEVLLCGHHGNIAAWRQAQSLAKTKARRPDLYAAYVAQNPQQFKLRKDGKPMLYPLKMNPCFKEMLWGGQSFCTLYQKAAPFEHTGESWEAADHKNGSSTVCGGALDGKTPGDLARDYGQDFLGTLVTDGAFPVLFKLIDARDRLSLQTHPDDALAKADGDRGKVEMWIILHAQPGAGLYLGFETPISEAQYRKRIEEGTLEEVLHFIPVTEGQCFFLPAGMVHAIGEGLLIGEIQQNSDTTYRVYDWGRVGLDGKPRALHIEKSLAASNRSMKGAAAEVQTTRVQDAMISTLPACEFFAADAIGLDGKLVSRTKGESVHILFCAKGCGSVTTAGGRGVFQAGDTYLIAAAEDKYTLEGKAELYRFWVPSGQ